MSCDSSKCRLRAKGDSIGVVWGGGQGGQPTPRTLLQRAVSTACVSQPLMYLPPFLPPDPRPKISTMLRRRIQSFPANTNIPHQSKRDEFQITTANAKIYRVHELPAVTSLGQARTVTTKSSLFLRYSSYCEPIYHRLKTWLSDDPSVQLTATEQRVFRDEPAGTKFPPSKHNPCRASTISLMGAQAFFFLI